MRFRVFFTKPFMFFLVMTLLLSACSASTDPNKNKISKTAFMLDTVVTVTLYDGDTETAERCLAECSKYEKIFSRTDPESELFALNHSDGMAVSDDLLSVLKTALYYCGLSGGAFDITMGALSDMYAFSSDSPRVPTADERAEALNHVDFAGIVIDGNVVKRTDPDTVIDLGAVAKGYIADRLADFLTENGKQQAVISLGGNIYCLGSRPDGSDYNVGIQYPFAEASKTIANVGVSNKSVVTSGIYERSFELDGTLYHHILDPKTGLPYQNGLLSVSIVSDRSVDGDALSTVCFALGLEDGMKLIDSLDGISAMFVTDDFETFCSEGFPILGK